MNMRKLLAGVLAVGVVLSSACSDDEKPGFKKQFAFEGNTVSLKDANLYLLYEETGGDHMYRDYFITDGTYEDGSGWNMTDYEDATYLLAVQVGRPAEEELVKGSYPLFYSFSTAPETSNIGWVSFETDDVYYTTPYEIIGGDPVKISGGFDDGDTMTITYNGSLDYYNEEETVSGKFSFKGKVQDMRVIDATRQATKVAAGGAK